MFENEPSPERTQGWSTNGRPNREDWSGSAPEPRRVLGRENRIAEPLRERDPVRAEAVDYAAFFGSLWRRKWMLIAITLLGVASSTLIILRLPPQYVAHAYVSLGDPYPRNRLVAGSANAPGAPPDIGTVHTEVEMLKSPQLALRVIKDLKLEDSPEFGFGGPQRDTVRGKVERLVGTAIPALIFGPAITPDPETAASMRTSLAIDAFRGRLSAKPRETSRMLDVAFEASDPRIAMRIANAVVDGYMSMQVELRAEMAKRNSSWLRERIGQLQGSVQEAERAVEQYRAQAGLFSTPGGAPLLLKEMTDVSAELAKSQTAAAALQAQLAQFKAASESDAYARSNANVPVSPLLQSLEAQEADVAQRLAEAQATLGPKNPATVGISDRLRHVRAAIRNERRRVTASLDEDLKVARRKESDLGARLGQLQADVARMNGAEIQLKALERDAQADRLILNTFISRFKEASQETDVSSQRPDAQVVSYAQLPAAPDKPKKDLLILICGLASLLMGATAVYVVEKRDRTLRDVQDVESQLNIRALGMIPHADAARLAPCEAARYGTEYREAVKGIYARLFWIDQPPKVVLITSAFPGEGKTTLALSLAAMAGQGSMRTLLIDADFWRKGASTALDTSAKVGLADVLEGKVRLGAAVVRDLASGADILVSGQFTRGSLVTWAGELSNLFRQLRNSYDVIIVDAPPLLSVTEAVLPTSHADATVLAVRWKSTPRDAVMVAIRRLRETGAAAAGAVITMVEDRRPAMYGDAQSKYLLASLRGYGWSTGAVTAEGRQPAVGAPGTALARSRRGLRSIEGRSAVRVQSVYALLALDVEEEAPATGQLRLGTDGMSSALLETGSRITSAAVPAGIILMRGLTRKGWLAAQRLQPEEHSSTHLSFKFTAMGVNAFSNPRVDRLLAERGVTHVFLAGRDVESVSKTARSALGKSYRVTIIRDTIFTDSEQAWAKTLKSLELEAVFAITSHEFLEFAEALQRPLDAEGAPSAA